MNKQHLLEQYKEKYNILSVVDLDQWADDKFFKYEIELKKTLADLYRTEYKNNQRIIFVADQHNHHSQNIFELLDTLQILLNQQNIHNFFVCLFLNHSQELINASQRLQQLSSDPVAIQIEYYQSDVAAPAATVLTTTELLSDSKTFCMYPWTHLYVHTTGEIYPCCKSVKSVGNNKTHTLEQVWNSDQLKSIRKSMLTGQYISNCTGCYETEKVGFKSQRQWANDNFAKYIDHTQETASDGSLERFELKRWEVKFSNLCNLKCRICHHVCSTAWYQDQIKMDGPEYKKHNNVLLFPGKHETDLLEQLFPHLDYVEQISFAGGEPLMTEEHYLILDELERRGKFDVKLAYSTNFTTFEFNGRSVFDYWKKFKNVIVNASLDDMGARGEYIRKGLVWSEAESNRRVMMIQAPNTTFRVNATLNVLNLFTLPDFHKNWVDQGLINISDFHINLLTHPHYLRADIVPVHHRTEVKEKYQQHVSWMQSNDAAESSVAFFENVINLLDGTDNSHLIPEFWRKTNQLDSIRNENALDVIPELRVLK